MLIINSVDVTYEWQTTAPLTVCQAPPTVDSPVGGGVCIQVTVGQDQGQGSSESQVPEFIAPQLVKNNLDWGQSSQLLSCDKLWWEQATEIN